ncbi:S-adenosylmethionine synthase [Sebaldella termitidis]|jgi:S-adenosylmethionine synthetase|uniref:S-adenosylmethionine synthase n=1 Tax=Sebaldella termitidis (strain ATCC 33386 / NCTC 11300) TaxID=526218 RepID=D1AIK1_SEBTE|nr:methionine adenosyltransferase [Sebaldella termitidis]ACZ08585.1 S-adenosylmethionine synthetase [Sebaldella termitidis ATCC 33386]SUI23900.1 S-adenosylmethionine synthase [Sebaldella termitidis]
MSKNLFFTSEFVSPGHPDKICDQISDAVLDACLVDDPQSRVACEVFATTGLVMVGGEITTNTYIDIQKIIREKIEEIGYRQGMGFDSDCGVLNTIHSQSPDIAMGVDTGGAGDQGIMFGGAVNETPELMPLALTLARSIINRLTVLTRSKELAWARPDAKAQVTLAYDENGEKVEYVDTVVLSVQHDEEVTQEEIKRDLKEKVIRPVLEKYGLDSEKVKKYHINPTGRFVIGGPHGDTGLTGRKIIVDTYGGFFRHGGGAFSGKDPSKVDRSAAYAARWIAKNIVSAGIADKCEVQLSYAIGVAEPTSIKVDTFGKSKVSEEKIAEAVAEIFDLTPRGIEKSLELREGKFRYQDLAAFGHIGRTDIDLPWERVNKAEELKKILL